MSNLITENQKKEIAREYYIRLGVVALSLSFLFGILSTSFLFPVYFLSHTKEKNAQTEALAFQSKNAGFDMKNLSSVVKDINAKLFYFATEPKKITVSKNVVQAMLDAKTSAIKISSIAYLTKQTGGQEIDIHGKAKDRESLLAFVDTLKTKEFFTKVDLPISNLVESKDLDFSITIQVTF